MGNAFSESRVSLQNSGTNIEMGSNLKLENLEVGATTSKGSVLRDIGCSKLLILEVDAIASKSSVHQFNGSTLGSTGASGSAGDAQQLSSAFGIYSAERTAWD